MPLGRPREFDIEVALDAAMDLFWTQGYESTSLQNLLDATSLSKSSLYKVFGSKQQLFEMAIEHYSKAFHRSMTKNLQSKSTGFSFIQDTLLFIAHEGERTAEPKGCLLINSINEWGIRDPQLKQLIIERFRTFEALFASAITRAQTEGDIPPQNDPRELASFLISSISGLRASVKAGGSKEKLEKIVDFILSSLQQNTLKAS